MPIREVAAAYRSGRLRPVDVIAEETKRQRLLDPHLCAINLTSGRKRLDDPLDEAHMAEQRLDAAHAATAAAATPTSSSLPPLLGISCNIQEEHEGERFLGNLFKRHDSSLQATASGIQRGLARRGSILLGRGTISPSVTTILLFGFSLLPLVVVVR